jgi:superfamily II DNA or RNA helicase
MIIIKTKMSVVVSLGTLDPKFRTKIEESLIFEYKQRDIMKKKKQKDYTPEVKTVRGYASAKNNHISLPIYWAWDNMKLFNDYVPEQRDYKRIKEPRDNLQENELAEVIDILEEKKLVALTIRTGAGKTAVSLFCACYFKQFTVVLVHNSDHCTQWYNSVKTYTTAIPEIVELGMNGVSNDTDILICLYTRWNQVPECVRNNVGLLIIDECDEYCNTTGVEAILAFHPIRVMGCTATFVRPGTGLETIMHSILGYSFVTRQFDVKFTVNKICTGITGQRTPAKHTLGPDWLVLKQSLLYNDPRNQQIVDVVDIRLNEGRKIMILTSEVNHVHILYTLLKEKFEKDDSGYTCDFLCGNKKSYKDSNVLVGGDKKCGRGFDEESFCKDWNGKRIDCIMIVDFINNRTILLQRIGRGFRSNDSIVDHFVDKDSTIEKQWNNCKKIYLELGADIHCLQLT